MEDPIEQADIILIPGGSRKELMDRAVALYKAGYAAYILPSGGFNKKLSLHETEYEFLKEEAMKQGVPESAILKEDRASNTFENAQFSYEVCQKNNIEVKKAILVCKNYHARRAYISYQINFPKNTEFIVQPIIDGEQITKGNWMGTDDKRNRVLGEVMRIGKYFGDSISVLL